MHLVIVLLAFVLLAAPKDAAATPWTVTFGNCSFSGDSVGAPLVRAGSCPSQSGFLNLRGRFITSLLANSFEGMGQMTRIDLSQNQLRVLPANLFVGLNSVYFINLKGNQLSTLPAGVFSGLSLYAIDLTHNALSTLPVGVFSGLGALTELGLLKGNMLQCVPLSSENRLVLPNAGPRTINHDLLKTEILGPTCTSVPWNLTFGNCRFSGDYAGAPLVRTGSCPSQSGFLNLRSRFITSLPANAFEGMAQMTAIILQNNQLSALQADVFNGLSSLIGLELDSNSLSALPADIFNGLTSLEYLYLYGNHLSALSANLFVGLTSLRTLSLRGNALSALPADVFNGLTSLTTLSLSGNHLSALPAGVFNGLTALASLSVRNFALQCVPLSSAIRHAIAHSYDGPVTCTSVPWTVTFGNCSFSGDYAGAPLVRTGSCPSQSGFLNLRGRFITSLPANAFEGVTQMTAITLENNQLSALSADVFNGLTSLESLRLNGNQLRTLSATLFVGLNSLRVLYLDENHLSALSATLFNGLTSLVSLGLSRNALSMLPVGAFSGLSNLRSLDLSKNALSTLPVGAFSGLGTLIGLDLGGNALSMLPEGAFYGLTRISTRAEYKVSFDSKIKTHDWGQNGDGGLYNRYLAETELPWFVVLDTNGDNLLSREEYEAGFDMFDIDKDGKISLSDLRNLILDCNPLTTLPENVFSGLIYLQGLAFNHNRLNVLPSGVFSGLFSLRTLYLGDYTDGETGECTGSGNQLECIPLIAQKRAAITRFEGPATLCMPSTSVPATSTVDGSTSTTSPTSTPAPLGSTDTSTRKPTSTGLNTATPTRSPLPLLGILLAELVFAGCHLLVYL